MSKLRVQSPVIHIPSFKEYKIGANDLKRTLPPGVEIMDRMLDSWYYHTDSDGWPKLLAHLMFSSKLYVPDRKDCDYYALKAKFLCEDLFNLNTMAYTLGPGAGDYHAYDMFFLGDIWLLWEPNEGFPYSGSSFEIGDFGYQPEHILI